MSTLGDMIAPPEERRQSVYRQAHSMTEAELRAVVVDMAHRKGWAVFSLPIIKTRRPVKDAVGYPDLTLARDGEVLWLELKQEDGKLSTPQFAWQLALPHMEVIRPSDLARGRVDELLA
jgi:hypothetical protein